MRAWLRLFIVVPVGLVGQFAWLIAGRGGGLAAAAFAVMLSFIMGVIMLSPQGESTLRSAAIPALPGAEAPQQPPGAGAGVVLRSGAAVPAALVHGVYGITMFDFTGFDFGWVFIDRHVQPQPALQALVWITLLAHVGVAFSARRIMAAWLERRTGSA